jgi:hypothetical protein
LGREQFSTFDPRPFGEALEEELWIARMQFETGNDEVRTLAEASERRSALPEASECLAANHAALIFGSRFSRVSCVGIASEVQARNVEMLLDRHQTEKQLVQKPGL